MDAGIYCLWAVSVNSVISLSNVRSSVEQFWAKQYSNFVTRYLWHMVNERSNPNLFAGTNF